MSPGAPVNSAIQTLFGTASVINLSDSDDFEVQPGVYSSVYVNLKALASNAASRKAIAKALVPLAAKFEPDYICGMELGGCYFAAHVADSLDSDLFFYRKTDKKYNITTRIAGNEPQEGSRVVVIDDVLSSGHTIAPVVDELLGRGCTVYVLCIFSYCWEASIAESLGVRISTLCDAKDLIAYGLAHNSMSAHNARLIEEYVAREENRLVQPNHVRSAHV